MSINQGEKIGLIGPNGAGKSTLFGLILQEAEPSSGTVQINKNVHIGYLPQEAKFHSDHTVLAELTEGDARILKLKEEKEQLEEKAKRRPSVTAMFCISLRSSVFLSWSIKRRRSFPGLGSKSAILASLSLP